MTDSGTQAPPQHGGLRVLRVVRWWLRPRHEGSYRDAPREAAMLPVID